MEHKENTAIIKENKMGVMPITKLLVNMSLPMMISMLVQALYNIVDSIFVANVNEYAVRAVSLSFPIQMLMIAVAVGSSIGVNALLSKALGEKNYEKVNSVASNGVFAIVICCLIFIILGFTVVEPFMNSQTDVPEVRAYGVSYLTICCVFSFGIFLQTIFEKLLQSTGKTILSMISQGIGAIVNIIMDPILIFGLLGFPRMEAAGAAMATVIGQIIAAISALIMNCCFNKEVRLKFKGFRPDFNILKQIYIVGAPSIVMQSIGSVMTYGMNLILSAYGVAQTAFGLYFKLQSFIFMPVFGLNSGMIPIIAYNYGAGKKERVIKTMKVSICIAVSIMLLGLVVIEMIPDKLLMLFNATDELLAVGVPALRIICLSFIFAGFCIIVGSVFQALGNGVYSMTVSIARQLIVLLPVAYLLSLTGNVTNIWWAFPLAELMAVGLSAFFLKKIYHKVICHIGEK